MRRGNRTAFTAADFCYGANCYILLLLISCWVLEIDAQSASAFSSNEEPQATVEVRSEKGTQMALGIVFGSLVGGLCLGFGLYFFCHRLRQRRLKKKQLERAEKRKQEKLDRKRRKREKEKAPIIGDGEASAVPSGSDAIVKRTTSQSRYKSSSTAGILIVGNTGAVTSTLQNSGGSTSVLGGLAEFNTSAASGSGVDTDSDFVPSKHHLINLDQSSTEEGVNELPSDSTFVSDGETIHELDDILPSPQRGGESGETGVDDSVLPGTVAVAEAAALAMKRRDEEGLIDFEIHPAVTSSQEVIGLDRQHLREVVRSNGSEPQINSTSTGVPTIENREGNDSSLSMTWGESGAKSLSLHGRQSKLALLRDDMDHALSSGVPPSPSVGDNPHFSLAFSDDGGISGRLRQRDSIALPTFVDTCGGPPSLPRTAGEASDINSTHGAETGGVVTSSTNVQEDRFRLMITNTVGDAEIVSRVQEIKAGRYTKLRCIGRGANGSVFSCLLGNGVTIAIKEISVKPEEQTQKILGEPTIGFGVDGNANEDHQVEFNERLRENFNKVAKEMRLLANINDPHVVQVYHCTLDTKNHKALIFMELISGGSVGAMVRTMPTRMDESIAKTYVKQLVLALASIHSKGIVHRDLKCDNVLLTVEGVVKLSDFGAAKLTRKSVERSNENGKPGSIAKSLVGTPFFIAPEVILDDKEGKGYDSKADIWSLGVTVSELLAKGELPWPKFNRAGAAFVHIARKGTVPEFPSFISDEARNFLTKCCARKPRDRPTAKELLSHPWLASIPETAVGNSILSVSGSTSSVAQGPGGTPSVRRSLMSLHTGSLPGTPNAPIIGGGAGGRMNQYHGLPPQSPKLPQNYGADDGESSNSLRSSSGSPPVRSGTSGAHPTGDGLALLPDTHHVLVPELPLPATEVEQASTQVVNPSDSAPNSHLLDSPTGEKKMLMRKTTSKSDQ